MKVFRIKRYILETYEVMADYKEAISVSDVVENQKPDRVDVVKIVIKKAKR